MTSEERKPIFVVHIERTPEEERRIEIENQTLDELKERIDAAKTLADFINNYFGLRLAWGESRDWLWDQGDQTKDSFMDYYTGDTCKKVAEDDVKYIEKLKTSLDKLPEEKDKIKVALVRARDKHGYYTYRVLAQFPKGKYAEDPVYGWVDRDTTEKPDILFYHPQAPCVEHTCDDLFKIHRNETFYIPYRTWDEARKRLEATPEGINEYQLNKEESLKQDAENYLLCCLQNVFSNEKKVARVSKFWNRVEQVID